jgi:hypothetical protein
MGWECGNHRGQKSMQLFLWWENLKERENCGNLGVNGNMIIK